MENVDFDASSFTELFDLYSNSVYRYAFAALGDAEEAYDVVQEVFLRAHKAISNFRHDANAKTWLMSITRHYVVDLIRQRQRHRSQIVDHELFQLRDPSVSMEVVLEVKEAFGQLKPAYRDVLVLRYVDGFSSRETAATLGWSEQKVRTTARRARIKLHDILGGG